MITRIVCAICGAETGLIEIKNGKLSIIHGDRITVKDDIVHDKRMELLSCSCVSEREFSRGYHIGYLDYLDEEEP